MNHKLCQSTYSGHEEVLPQDLADLAERLADAFAHKNYLLDTNLLIQEARREENGPYTRRRRRRN